MGGIVADQAAGNENGEIRSVVQIAATTMEMGLGLTIKPEQSISVSSNITSLNWSMDEG